MRLLQAEVAWNCVATEGAGQDEATQDGFVPLKFPEAMHINVEAAEPGASVYPMLQVAVHEEPVPTFMQLLVTPSPSGNPKLQVFGTQTGKAELGVLGDSVPELQLHTAAPEAFVEVFAV